MSAVILQATGKFAKFAQTHPTPATKSRSFPLPEFKEGREQKTMYRE